MFYNLTIKVGTKMKISEKLVILRKRKGYSQEGLANELDVSRQAVYKWETESSVKTASP